MENHRIIENKRIRDYYDEACDFARNLFIKLDRSRIRGANVKGFRLADEKDAIAVVYEALCFADKYYKEDSGRTFREFAKKIIFQQVIDAVNLMEGRKRHRGKDNDYIIGEDRMVLFSELVNKNGESIVEYVCTPYLLFSSEEDELKKICKEEVDKRMEGLTEQQKKTIIMYYGLEGDEMNISEIAQRLGKTSNSVSKIKSLAERKMAED